MKKCSVCGVSRPLGNFPIRSAAPDGHASACKPCESESKKRQRALLRARSEEEIEASARGPRACRICKEVKESNDFPRDRGRRDGRGTICLTCSAALTRHYTSILDPVELKRRKAEYYRKGRATQRRYKLKAKFGITREQYDEMLEAQGGACAICRKPETELRGGRVKELCVDHCHVTQEVRRLLCANCNKGLGCFHDSPGLLREAALYLEGHLPAQQNIA